MVGLAIAQSCWVASVWLSASALSASLALRTARPLNSKYYVCWAFVLAMLLEGAAFTMSALDPALFDFEQRSDLRVKVGFMVVQCTQAGFGWAKALFLNDRQGANRDDYWKCAAVGAALGIAGGLATLLNWVAIAYASHCSVRNVDTALVCGM